GAGGPGGELCAGSARRWSRPGKGAAGRGTAISLPTIFGGQETILHLFAKMDLRQIHDNGYGADPLRHSRQPAATRTRAVVSGFLGRDGHLSGGSPRLAAG